jgi:hypothetical protein
VQEQVHAGKLPGTPGMAAAAKLPSGARSMREVESTPVFVLRMSTACVPMASASITPLSRPHSCRADDILPQLTLQSMAAWPLASCAGADEARLARMLLHLGQEDLVAGGRAPSQSVTCRLPGSSPLWGTPIRWRSNSSRRAGSGGTLAACSTRPVEVPPRMWWTETR